MKIGKIIIAGVAVFVFDFIVGMVTCGGLFNWVYKVEPTVAWKSMSGAPGMDYMIGSFVLSVILVLVYAILKKGIPGNNRLAKGAIFGLCVWAVGTLPGMFATYIFMNVSTTFVIYIAIHGIIFMPIRGMVISSVYGD
jgi:hypothetical protein